MIRVLQLELPPAAKLLEYLCQIDESRIYSNYGPLSEVFAKKLGDLTNAPGIVLTSSGTSALELALRATTDGPGICMMPSYTFIATAHAVVNAGLTPYLLDIDESSLMLTPQLVLNELRKLPCMPKAVVPVSAFGAPIDTKGWDDFSVETGIPVAIDAAAAVTNLDYIGLSPICVSLHCTKVLGIGEGGAVLTSDMKLQSQMKAMTGFGFTGQDRISHFRGGNSRMSEYAAAVGLAVLDHLPRRLDALKTLATKYITEMSSNNSWLQKGIGSSWQAMTLNAIVPSATVTETEFRLDQAGIEWRRWWGFGTHSHPVFSELERSSLDVTNEIAPRVIGVPFHVAMNDNDIREVAGCLP